MKKFMAEGIDSFKGLAASILQIMVDGVGHGLEAILNQLDDELEHPGRGWESIGKRERRLVTLFGLEIVVKRRGYRRRSGGKTEETIFPLDQALGLRPEERFCPLVQHLAITLATKISFREVAALLCEAFAVPVSHQEVHRWVTEAGEAREQEERQKVAAAFEQGEEIACSDRVVPVVVAEADGVCVSLQREPERVLELKIGVMHQGWRPETPSGNRVRLVNKVCWGGNLTATAFWERGLLRLAESCDPAKVERVILNGDGAPWIKQGREHLGAEWHLDPYHLQRAVRQGLWHDSQRLAEALTALGAGELDRLEQVLRQALEEAATVEVRTRVLQLRQYLKANWDGLVDWRKRPGPQPEGAKSLGAMEGQVRHIAAARMKRRGASWTKVGANNMLQLRLLDQTDELNQWLDKWEGQRGSRSVPRARKDVPSQVLERLSKFDPAEWLRAGIPLIQTKAGRSPLGRALKGLASMHSIA